jgi:hypothetical protein
MNIRISNYPEIHRHPVEPWIRGGHSENGTRNHSRSGTPAANVLVGGTPALPDRTALGNQTGLKGETGTETAGVTGTLVQTVENAGKRRNVRTLAAPASARSRRADPAAAPTMIRR